MLLPFAFLLLVSASPDAGTAAAREWPRLEANEAESATRGAWGFWGVAMGLDGHPTPAVVGYRSLLAAPDGAQRFERILKTATLPGQLYALCGLYMLDRKSFGLALKELWLANPDTAVEVGMYDGSTATLVREVLGSEVPTEVGILGATGAPDIASGAQCRILATQPLPTKCSAASRMTDRNNCRVVEKPSGAERNADERRRAAKGDAGGEAGDFFPEEMLQP